jgi:integrase
LEQLPRDLHSPYVFANPKTGKPFWDIRKPFQRACKDAGIASGQDAGVVPHDLRRTSITEARRAGIPESVVMKMSGHKTRSVFARYNIVEEDDLEEAVRKLQAHRAGQDLVKVT